MKGAGDFSKKPSAPFPFLKSSLLNRLFGAPPLRDISGLRQMASGEPN